MPNLYSTSAPPTWTVPAPLLQRQPTTRPSTLIGYRFDPYTLDIAVDGGGHVLYSSPEETALQAAAFIVSIQQAAYPIFSRGFGSDLQGALMQRGSHAQMESRVMQTMQRAIEQANDRRLRALENFTFTWELDVLTVIYTIVLANGARYRQTRRISLV